MLLEGFALVAVACLPLIADATRQRSARCAQDGVEIDPAFAAFVQLEHGSEVSFCGVSCADHWMSRSGRAARAITVTECVRGKRIDASVAFYVTTYAGLREGVPDQIRVFASVTEADAHIQAYGGELLVGARRPFSSVTLKQEVTGRVEGHIDDK